jgi:hypothetical protein
MVRPSHTKRAFVAQRIFTDREYARRIFLGALDVRQGAEDYRVIVFYGVGGQGKTALCHEFQRLLRARDDYRPVGSATVNFDNPTHRTIGQALLAIRYLRPWYVTYLLLGMVTAGLLPVLLLLMEPCPPTFRSRLCHGSVQCRPVDFTALGQAG